MAGRKGRSGRRPLSIEEHLRRGSYRRDRHGPRPSETATTSPGPAVDAGLTARVRAGLGPAGLRLVDDHLEHLADWTPRDLALLRQAGEARDRQVEIAAAMAADGVLLRGKRGQLSAHPLLRAERAAAAAVTVNLRALDIVDAPAQSDRVDERTA